MKGFVRCLRSFCVGLFFVFWRSEWQENEPCVSPLLHPRCRADDIVVGLLLSLLYWGSLLIPCGDFELNPAPTRNSDTMTVWKAFHSDLSALHEQAVQTETQGNLGGNQEPTLCKVMSVRQNINFEFKELKNNVHYAQRDWTWRIERVDFF